MPRKEGEEDPRKKILIKMMQSTKIVNHHKQTKCNVLFFSVSKNFIVSKHSQIWSMLQLGNASKCYEYIEKITSESLKSGSLRF